MKKILKYFIEEWDYVGWMEAVTQLLIIHEKSLKSLDTKNVLQKKTTIPKKKRGSIHQKDTKEMRVCVTTPTGERAIPPMRPPEGVSL